MPARRCILEDVISKDDIGTYYEELVYSHIEVDLDIGLQMLGEDLTSLKWSLRKENFNLILIEQEMEVAKANAVDINVVSYMEATFENKFTWEGMS